MQKACKMTPDWSPKGAQILSKSLNKKMMPNGIQKVPDAVSERKSDPGGVREFGTRRFGIAWRSLWGSFSVKKTENGIQKAIQKTMRKTLKTYSEKTCRRVMSEGHLLFKNIKKTMRRTDTWKVMKVHEHSMRKWSNVLYVLKHVLRENTVCEKGACTETTLILQ